MKGMKEEVGRGLAAARLKCSLEKKIGWSTKVQAKPMKGRGRPRNINLWGPEIQ